MSFRKKIKIILMLSFALALFWNVKAFASSISVSAPGSVSPGGTVTVTVAGNDAIGKFGISVSGGSANVSSIWVDGSASFNVTAGSSGTVRVSVSAIDVSNNSGGTVSPSGSASISISSNNGNNNNNNNGNSNNNGGSGTVATKKITSLGITPYEYDFQNYSIGAPSGSTYYAKVPNEVSSITIYANGATSGTGTKTLKEGTNKFTVSNADFTYYIIVTRATLDGDEPANKSDGEEQENSEENDGIGLESLEIEGYELDKEFETSVYEYVVKVEENLTLEKLNEIKELVIAVANTEGVTVRVEAEISEEGVATITVFVEDEEKEYAKYVITFEVEDEEKDEVIGVVAKTNNSKGTPITGMFGLTEQQQIFAILAAFGLVTFIAFVYSVVAYVQHRKLLEYEEEYDEEYEDDTEFGKMNRYYNDVETPDSNIDEIDNTQTDSQEEPNVQLASEDDKSTLEKAVDYERKLFKSRGLRSTRKGGKHF
ncbi:MAG: hypothetical protein ACI4VN_03245 [Clostridia bacterium]